MHVVASLRSEETVVSIKKQLTLTIFYVSSKTNRIHLHKPHRPRKRKEYNRNIAVK